MRDKIGLGNMVWDNFIEKNKEIYALFDVDEEPHIRGLAWHKEDLVKMRKKLKWSKECKIKLIRINWRDTSQDKNEQGDKK